MAIIRGIPVDADCEPKISGDKNVVPRVETSFHKTGKLTTFP